MLKELERNGPLLSRRFEDRAKAPWPSSGWTGDRNVGQMLEFLMARGDVEPLPHAEADAYFEEERFRAAGVLLRKGEWVAHPVHWEDKPVAIEKPVRALDRFLGVKDIQWP